MRCVLYWFEKRIAIPLYIMSVIHFRRCSCTKVFVRSFQKNFELYQLWKLFSHLLARELLTSFTIMHINFTMAQTPFSSRYTTCPFDLSDELYIKRDVI